MKESEIISWIFMAIAIASETGPTDISGISMIADGINHAVPTQSEMQTSIAWLSNKDLIVKQGKKYSLMSKGQFDYQIASEESNTLFEIWKILDSKIESYL